MGVAGHSHFDHGRFEGDRTTPQSLVVVRPPPKSKMGMLKPLLFGMEVGSATPNRPI
jgi:hypothetical protein